MQSNKRYADPDYPGRGKLLCYICDRPTIEHPISRSCPFPRVANPRSPKRKVHWPTPEPQYVVVED